MIRAPSLGSNGVAASRRQVLHRPAAETRQRSEIQRLDAVSRSTSSLRDSTKRRGLRCYGHGADCFAVVDGDALVERPELPSRYVRTTTTENSLCNLGFIVHPRRSFAFPPFRRRAAATSRGPRTSSARRYARKSVRAYFANSMAIAFLCGAIAVPRQDEEPLGRTSRVCGASAQVHDDCDGLHGRRKFSSRLLNVHGSYALSCSVFLCCRTRKRKSMMRRRTRRRRRSRRRSRSRCR